jgi:hypothetical protein
MGERRLTASITAMPSNEIGALIFGSGSCRVLLKCTE